MSGAATLIADLVDANHILFRQGVLDGFGHVSGLGSGVKASLALNVLA